MKKIIVVFFLLVIFGFGSKVYSKVKGQCANCHTMHYSQHPAVSTWGSSGPYKALVINDCLGCHTGTNTGTNTTPYVLSDVALNNATDYGDFGISGSTLAGGNFYWVAQGDDRAGHNVVGLNNPDDLYGNTPPGGTALAQQLTCAGAYGCHGDRNVVGDFESILGAHHSDDDPDGNGIVDGDGLGNYTVGTSFRFLYGVKGIEDSDWEYQPTSTEHNQYYAVDGSLDSQSINYLCCECHGNFHAISGTPSTISSPWFRHPTDFALSSATGSGYTNYPGPFDPTTGTYFPGVPLGSDLTTGVVSLVTFSGKDDIVLCISCHRAHGSPYKKIMRWDYYDWPETTTVNGCNACHTTKD